MRTGPDTLPLAPTTSGSSAPVLRGQASRYLTERRRRRAGAAQRLTRPAPTQLELLRRFSAFELAAAQCCRLTKQLHPCI